MQDPLATTEPIDVAPCASGSRPGAPRSPPSTWRPRARALRPRRRRLRHLRRASSTASTRSRPSSGATSGRRSRSSRSGLDELVVHRLARRLPGRRRRAVGLRRQGRRRRRFARPGPGHGRAAPRSPTTPWLGVHTHFSLVRDAPRAARLTQATRDRSLARRSAVMAEQCTGRGADGVVCAAAPLAAQAGATALRDGGNAFDAAVAAALAETVLLPSKCGLGGDLVAIVVCAPAPLSPEALLAIGGAPRGLAEVASQRVAGATPARCRSGPPAAPAGYLALAARRPAAARPPRRAGDRAGRRRVPVGGRQPPPRPWPASNCCGDGTPRAPSPTPAASRSPPARSCASPAWRDALASFVERGDGFLAGPVGAGDRRHGAQPGRRARRRRPRLRQRRVDRVRPGRRRRSHGVGDAGADPRSDAARRGRRRPARRRSGAQYRSGAGADRRAATRQARRPVGHVDRSAPPTATATASSSSTPTPTRATAAGSSSPTTTSSSPTAPAAASRPSPATPTSRVAGRRPATTLHAWAVADDNGRPRFSAARPAATTRCRGTPSCCRRSSTARSARDARDRHRVGVAAGRRRRAHRGRLRRRAAAALAAAAPRAVRVGRWGLPCAQQVIAVPVARRGDRRRRRPAHRRPRPRRVSHRRVERCRWRVPGDGTSPSTHRLVVGGGRRSPARATTSTNGVVTATSRSGADRRLAEATDQPAGGGADADLRRAICAERRTVRPK